MKKFAVVFIALLLVLSSCASNNGLVYTKNLLENAPDADSALRQIVREHKIVFIGEITHTYANMGVFLDKHMQMLYDEGVRYIFYEGTGEAPEGYEAPLYGTWYPWSYTTGRYSRNSLNAEEEINKTAKDGDTIKSIALEKGRISFSPETSTGEIDNYRAKLMYENFTKAMISVEEGAKCLITAGDLHGATKELYTHFAGSDAFHWKPLGAYIKEEYRDDYFALSYQTTVIGNLFFGIEPSAYPPEWNEIPEQPKFLYPHEMEAWAKNLPISFDPVFDGYIIEKEGVPSIPFEYAVFDNKVLEKMVAYLEYQDKKVADLNENYDYADGDTYYLLDEYLRGMYYIKLYFGEQFKYDMWNPQISLKEALDDLYAQVHENNFTELVTLQIPDDEGLKEYKARMQVFYAIISMLEEGGDPKLILDNSVEYILNTQKLIPQDLWTMYLLALMYTLAEDYDTGLEYWQELFSDPLVKSMHIYPEALEYASLCAKELGEVELSQSYLVENESLWNERNIDVRIIELLN